MSYCIVSGCSNRNNTKRKNWIAEKQLEKENSSQKFTFHLLPKDADKRNEWLEALNLKNWHPCKTAAVCSAHFKPEDYVPQLTSKRLKKDVIPYLSISYIKKQPLSEVFEEKIENITKPVSVEQDLNNVEVGTSNNVMSVSTNTINSPNVRSIAVQHTPIMRETPINIYFSKKNI